MHAHNYTRRAHQQLGFNRGGIKTQQNLPKKEACTLQCSALTDSKEAWGSPIMGERDTSAPQSACGDKRTDTQPALRATGTPSKGMHNSAPRQVLLWNWGLSKLFCSCAVRSRLLLLPCITHSTPTTTPQILAADRGHRGFLSPQKPETWAWGRQCLAAVQLLGRRSCERVPPSCNAAKVSAGSERDWVSSELGIWSSSLWTPKFCLQGNRAAWKYQ